MQKEIDFWERMSALIDSGEIIIDRPKGSPHPRFPALVYPVDYGYLAGTSAVDGNEIDIFRGTREDGGLVGIICTVDTLKRDTEVKLLIACTDSEMELVEYFFKNNNYMSGLLIKRPEA